MRIGIDFDETITLDPGFSAEFVALGAAAQAAAVVSYGDPGVVARRWSHGRDRIEIEAQAPQREVTERIRAAIAAAGALYPPAL